MGEGQRVNDMWVGLTLSSPLHTTEQGWVGALTMLWYNTYTKKALYCIEFRKGGREGSPLHPCVCHRFFFESAEAKAKGGGGVWTHRYIGRHKQYRLKRSSGEASHFRIIFLSVLYISFYCCPCPKITLGWFQVQSLYRRVRAAMPTSAVCPHEVAANSRWTVTHFQM